MIQPVAAVSLGYPSSAPAIHTAAPPPIHIQPAVSVPLQAEGLETAHTQSPVSVQLSLAAEIRILESQGVSIHNIALRLGLENDSVAEYLA